MATKTTKKSIAEPKPISNARNVVMNVTIDRDVYNAACDYRKSMGLSMDQDVVRLALATFLKREGYLNS